MQVSVNPELASDSIEPGEATEYAAYMPRKKAPPGSLLKQPLGKNYITEWREHRNDMTQDRLAERVVEYSGRSFTAATLSRIENSKSPYSQWQLEAMADALQCTPGDLIMRNPLDTEAPWSLWERFGPEQRKHAIRLWKTIIGEEAA